LFYSILQQQPPGSTICTTLHQGTINSLKHSAHGVAVWCPQLCSLGT